MDTEKLRCVVEDLIREGVTEFLVGNNGQFDGAVFSCLRELGDVYPGISYSVALAYLPTRKQDYDVYGEHSFFPEGQEMWLARFAIERRNRYLIRSADICVCYINRTFGGAYKFARMAKNRGLRVINLGAAEL